MKHAQTQELYSYWLSLCRGRSAPERNEIDPAAIRGILADTFMIEVDDVRATARAYPIRLSGTRINALFDKELKGTSMLELWAGSDRADVMDLIGGVLDSTTPAVAGCVGSPSGHPPLGLELILLPLRHRGRTHVRLLGGLSPQAVPSWLGLVPVEELRLTSHRMIEAAPTGGEQPGFDAFRRQRPVGRSPLRRGHFVIYDGGRSADRRDSDLVDASEC